VSVEIPADQRAAFDLHCHRCGRPADRVEDAEGLAGLLAPRMMPPPPPGAVMGRAVRMEPAGISPVTAGQIVQLGPLCDGHEPKPGQAPYSLLRSVR